MNDIAYNPGREQVTPLASPNIITERVRNDPQENVNALLRSLGTESTKVELARLNAQHEARKLEEQKGKFEWYVEQFQADHAGGAVSQAQVKGRFPETVPIIAARIAEAVGNNEGRKKFQSVIEEIAGNDALRLDTQARAAFLAKKRAELTAQVGQGNEFYGAGMVQAMDRLTQQYEANWASETAQYHQKVQAEAFTNEVVDAFNGGNPAALLDLDKKWAASSSLNNLDRNKLVVNAAVDLAFAGDDPEVLQKVPQRFLNADSKAQLEKARLQITETRLSNFRNARSLELTRREEARRAMEVEIVGKVAAGETIDPGKYRNDPDAFQFALRMREAPRLNESQSLGNAALIRDHILTANSAGISGETLETYTDKLVSNQYLNPKERQALISELPKLIEGQRLMGDDFVRGPIMDRLGPRLQALESSTNSTIQALLTGRNLRSEIMAGYEGGIRRGFVAFYEETGKWPTGEAKRRIVNEVTEWAERRLEEATRISSAAPAAKVSSASQAPSPAAPRNAIPSASRQDSIGTEATAELARRAGGLPRGVVKLH